MSVTARGQGPSRSERYGDAARGLLVAGWAALVVALLAAHGSPATGYELSIYAATPLTFWSGVAVAFLAGLAVAVAPTARTLRGLALALAGAAVLAVVALPYLRGYAFYGTADPLTHLGLARGLLDGGVDPFTMVYPGLHSVAALLAAVSGLPVARTLLLVLVAFAASFLVFVPLCVAAITDRWTAVVVGALAGAAFLPVNHIGTHFRAHPFSQTVLLSALVVYLALKHLAGDDAANRSVTGTTGLLALGTVAVVLYHPQQATTLLVLFVAVCAVQFVYRRRSPTHSFATHQPLYVPTAVFGVTYVLWVVPSQWFFRTVTRHATAFVAFLLGQGRAGTRLGTQTASLFAVGATVPEMFVKLFLPTALFVLFAGALFLLGTTWITDVRRRTTLRYLWIGVGLAATLTVLYLFADVAEMYFRHFAVVMLLATILGAAGLAAVASRVSERTAPVWGRSVVAVVVLLSVGLSAGVAYQSPYIYKANQHVTEMQLDGYETAFETAATDVQIAGIRVPPERYHDAFVGPGVGAYYDGRVAAENVSRLVERYDRDQYVIVTRIDRDREVSAYRGLSYSQSDFDSLDAQPGVHHVSANGEVDLYYVPAGADAS